ncbi:MAG TPA: hypothetical protein VFO29_06945 [Candidatus Rubrimentiphilum sp.]|nr:hypothetical protein [Candidatus Rubrimentiphilum sp.]
MFRGLTAAVTSAVLFAGAALAAQAAKPAASPLVQAQLKGHWVCMQTGTSSGTFNEDWTPVFGGSWLRATDSVKGVTTAEHTLTYSKAISTWIVLDAFPTGAYDILHGTGTGATRIAFHAVYPKLALAVTYARLSPAKYTVDVNGNIQGKKLATHSVCAKR